MTTQETEQGKKIFPLKITLCEFDIKWGRLTVVLRVADSERTPADLLFEQVLLVEKEDDGGEREPLVVANGVEELHALMHPVLRRGAEVILT